MTVKLYSTATLIDIISVCAEACEDEREQYQAFTGREFDPDTAAREIAAKDGPSWTICVDEKPVIVGGFDFMRPGVWQDWMVSTRQAWGATARMPVSRRVRRVMDRMLETEAHRLQCISLRSRIQAHKWYRVLGLRQEAALEAYGAEGEDAILFARVRAER